jgi:glyoxylase-like metal-dependent hydrolase (beta-lactamase superfamily II)
VSQSGTNGLVHPFPTPPAPGSTALVAPGIRWVRMPLPFALDHINLWLLEDGDGWALVDTGIGLATTRELWEQLFATGLGGRPITRIVVTHFHPDHMGNAGWFADRFGLPVACTAGEWAAAQRATRIRTAAQIEHRLAHYRRHGLDEDAIAAFRRRGNPYLKGVPSLAPRVETLTDGDVLAIGRRSWRVITVHGHAPEHACLWSEDDRVLISGDQVLPKITTNVSVWPDVPDANPLRLYLDSFARFETMPDDALALPSHGLPFHGLHRRIDMLRDHHGARLDDTLEALDRPRSSAELVPRLFPRAAADIHQLGFAIGEVLAHLHLLESEHRVHRVPGADAVDRFARV